MARPNPLTDELSDDAKAELAAIFANLERRYAPIDILRMRTRAGRYATLSVPLPRAPRIRHGW